MIRKGHQKNGEQEYKCKRCSTRFNRRKGTPLERLRTPINVILLAIALYMCGVGVAMIADVTGRQEKTVERWIRRIAPHCKELIKQVLSKQNHGFTSPYLQMDEFCQIFPFFAFYQPSTCGIQIIMPKVTKGKGEHQK